jgi:DNA-binding NtrC family response regulator
MKVTFNNMVLLYKLIMASSNAKTIGNTIVFSLIDDNGNIRTIEDLEWIAIDHAIQYYNGCMSEVARGLGIGRSTLYRKLNARNKNETELPVKEELSLNYVA